MHELTGKHSDDRERPPAWSAALWNASLSRRGALKRLGVLATGAAVGCTPLRIILHAYPSRFDEDSVLVDRVLRAFVTAVIPGAPIDAPHLVEIYSDDFYPFAPHRSFFVADLCRRALGLYGTDRFDELSPAQRTRVIQDGVTADAISRKLYDGAILLAQLSFYPNIYDDEAACPLIEFEGRYRIRPRKELCYPNADAYFASRSTRDGNYG